MIFTSRNLTAILGAATGAVLLTLAGCGGATVNSNSGTTVTTPPVIVPTVSTGHVHSGAVAVSGATIKLYAVSTSGYGDPSSSLMTAAVTTGTDGGFAIAGTYTCPANNPLVYVVATGGNPGVTGTQNNSGLAMMAGIGQCNGMASASAIEVNELTTVASVWALSGFMNSPAAVGSPMTNTQGLANAFAAINKIVSVSAGTMPGAALPTGATLPTENINTLANILAACVNTVNPSSGTISANCTSLFTNTTVSGVAPTNTIQAALNMAKNPVLNVTALNTLANAAGTPYTPSLGTSAPTSWQIAVNYVGGGLSAPNALALDNSGNVWITNGGTNSVSELSNSGAALSGAAGFTAGGISTPVSIAIDSNNTAWVANKGNDTLTHLSATGTTGTAITGGGLNKPSGVAIDQNGDVWAANSGNSSLSEFTAAGTALSSASGITGGGLNQPVALAIQQ
jgi:hypothetical protein